MVAVSWIERDSKMDSEGMSSSAGGQFGSGTLGGTGMVSNLVLVSLLAESPELRRDMKRYIGVQE